MLSTSAISNLCPEDTMNQIKKVSSYLIVAVNALLFMLPLFLIVQWLFIASLPAGAEAQEGPLMESPYLKAMFHESVRTPEGMVSLSSVHWTPLAWLLGFCAQAIALVLLLMGLVILKKLLQNYYMHEIFSVINAQYYKKLGVLCCVQALLAKPLSDMLMTIAATVNNPPGHRCISIGFGTPNVALLFCGACILVISWVMQEASSLHDEQRFTI